LTLMEETLGELEVASAAGTSAEVIRHLVELGILEPVEDRYRPDDLSRARLALALEASGVALEDVGKAIGNGGLSLRFVDLLMPKPVRLLPRSQGQVLGELGVSRELSERFRTLLGSRQVDDDEPIRSDDAELFRMVAAATATGADDEHIARALRVFVENLHRVVDVQREFIDEMVLGPAIAELGSPIEALEATSERRLRFRELGAKLLEVVHQRLVDDAVFANLVELTEAALAREGVEVREAVPPAVAFIDVSGYTRMTEEAGDQAAASQSAKLAEVVQELATPRSGRLVKLLGDGAMLHFPAASAAVRLVLDVVGDADALGLPPLHAGVNAGPMVRRDGDYFGTTVNVAARASGEAGAGDVIVTEQVVHAWSGDGGVTFEPRGPVSLKNVAQPVPLYRAVRAPDGR